MIVRSILAACLTLAAPAFAADPYIILQSTTSTQNSGLYDFILPKFTDATGISVRVVAVGTGQAIKNAANCDGDVLLVHAKSAEEAFVADGFGVERYDLMYNDFVLVGPPNDPADLKDDETASDAFSGIAKEETIFASRGDESGTHKKERTLWDSIEIDPTKASGAWYRETGSGMGATLNIAVEMNAYALTDRATWLAFQNQRDHEIVFEGDPALFNQYGVILVDQDHCPKVKAEEGQAFVDWLLGEGQAEIGAYTRDGTQLFFPNAQSGN